MRTANTLTFDYVKSLVLSKGGWRSIYSSYPNLLNAMETSSTKPCPKRGAPGLRVLNFVLLKTGKPLVALIIMMKDVCWMVSRC